MCFHSPLFQRVILSKCYRKENSFKKTYKRFVKEFQRTFISDITSYLTEKTVPFFNKANTKEQLFWHVNQEICRSWQESFLDFCRGLPVWINLFLCCCFFLKKYNPYSEFKVLMRFALPFRDVLERLRASARIGLISDIKKNTRPMYLVTICSDSTVFTFIISLTSNEAMLWKIS